MMGSLALLLGGAGWSWEMVFRLAASQWVTGFLTGGAFSVVLALAYRNKRLSEINASGFALFGGFVAVVFSLIVPGAAPFVAAVLGGATAGGTIKVAQRAAQKLRDASPEALLGEHEESSTLPAEAT